jgi:hypothetical protein
LRLAASVLIRASWRCSRERRDRLIARVLALIHYHQANIAAAKASHAKKRKVRFRQLGIALGECSRCE